jgi:hypothetical protein
MYDFFPCIMIVNKDLKDRLFLVTTIQQALWVRLLYVANLAVAVKQYIALRQTRIQVQEMGDLG